MSTIPAKESVFCLVEVFKRKGDHSTTFKVKEGTVNDHWWIDSSLFYDIDIHGGERVGMPGLFVFRDRREAVNKARELTEEESVDGGE